MAIALARKKVYKIIRFKLLHRKGYGEDLPRDLTAFQQHFTTEDAYKECLFHSRWPEGFHCPHCACDSEYHLKMCM